MKKLSILLIALLLVAFTCTGASALLKVSALGAYYSYNGGSLTGYGLQVSLPIIPLLDTNVEAIMCPGTSGGVNYSFMPITLNAEFGIPMTSFYLGGGVGTALFNATGVTIPTPIIYNVHAGYRHNLAPLVSAFIQAGYEVINMTVTTGTLPLPHNLSGFSVKGGIGFGL
ncbi:MAG: hypothetical protein KKB81_07985 [Candidatus Margulisbacteria bacterium]|nr:hypothetical protein [Candidatus Margulisiibacteriota bacterium]MBU1021766.1 hypothetical protein [Candidatus Margulisiibacteriota bacterium]MBU1729512.1 hypothetical protein [Candidatus Margulisiibacteriota bacterium]MBU1955387.1 hypothetical protein [Candidatus Margulisiibacteriota bacterium]